MSTSLSTTSQQRLLVPVSGKIQNEGAPFVPLSPHKGMHNAAIIYQAISHMPDKTLIRGDFDKKSRPMIYFPERPPKKIGSLTLHFDRESAQRTANQPAIAGRNATCDREELASFLKSIVDAAFLEAPARSPLLKATVELSDMTQHVMKDGRDFLVGDIRKPLKVIARAYELRDLKGIASPYRQRTAHDPERQAKRFRQFVAMDKAVKETLCNAFRDAGDEGNVQAMVQEMQDLLRKFRIRREAGVISFPAYIRQHHVPINVYRFAQSWVDLNMSDKAVIRRQLCTEAWSLEMDRICPVIVKAHKAHKREWRRGSSSLAWRGVETMPTLLSTEASLSHSSCGARPKPVAAAKLDRPDHRKPTRADRNEIRITGKVEDSEPTIVFLSPKAEIRKVLSYSAIDLSALGVGWSIDPNSLTPGKLPDPAIRPEEQTVTADNSGGGERISHEDQ